MQLAKHYFKEFMKAYRYHRWPKPRRGSGGQYRSPQWTEEMRKILDKTAQKMGLKRKRTELRKVDLTWYKDEKEVPTIVVEHENGYEGIWDEEIPKLLSSNAQLRVLICYPPRSKRWIIGNKLLNLLNEQRRLSEFDHEFLLILGDENIMPNDTSGFMCYSYTPEFRIRRLRH